MKLQDRSTHHCSSVRLIRETADVQQMGEIVCKSKYSCSYPTILQCSETHTCRSHNEAENFWPAERQLASQGHKAARFCFHSPVLKILCCVPWLVSTDVSKGGSGFIFKGAGARDEPLVVHANGSAPQAEWCINLRRKSLPLVSEKTSVPSILENQLKVMLVCILCRVGSC